MSDEKDNGRPSAPGGRQPLNLKPRLGAGSVSAGTVKQSFSHGRSKTVVVETKRARTATPPAGNLAGPSPAERRTTAPAPAAASRPTAPVSSSDGGLSADELKARQRAIELAREHQARQAAETRARAEAEARAQAAARAAAQAESAPVAPPPAAEAPAASAPAPAPASPPPSPPPAPAAAATPSPRPAVEAGRAAAPGQTRTYEPSRERRDDRPTTTTYRPDRPAGRFENTSFGQRAPRTDQPPRDRAGSDRPRDGDRGREGRATRASPLPLRRRPPRSSAPPARRPGLVPRPSIAGPMTTRIRAARPPVRPASPSAAPRAPPSAVKAV